MTITPVHPDDVEPVAVEHATTALDARRALGDRSPSRRTFGVRKYASRRTLGFRKYGSRRTLGRRIPPSRRTLMPRVRF